QGPVLEVWKIDGVGAKGDPGNVPVVNGVVRYTNPSGISEVALPPGGQTSIALGSVLTSQGPAWVADGTNQQFTCPVTGVYDIVGIAALGSGGTTGFFYVGIYVNNLVIARSFGPQYGYTGVTCSQTWTLNAGDK